MAVTWVTPAGDLGTLEERITVNIVVESTTDTANSITNSIIAGSLPRGLYLEGNRIKGTPVEVTKHTVSRFVIRAYDGEDEKDRTFSLTVDGSDFPEWITNEGYLNVGPGEAYFILDDSQVDFQLSATDTDIIAGDVLEYYVVPNSGTLPPGLTLSKTGKISGFTQPILATAYNLTPTGAYDTASFDTTPLDLARNTSLGFDSYFYDNVKFDYGETSRVPPKQSRIYTFGVAVTDGLNAVQRIFKIYVVSEDFLKADNTLLQVDTNLFQADGTNDRVPLWLTDSYLGRKRANNYVTIFLEVYDPPTLNGVISYLLVSQNPDGTTSTLPPGTTLDSVSGEVAGRIPYQAAVTRNYKFTVVAVNFPTSLSELSFTLVGNWSSTRTYAVNEAVRYDNLIYVCIKENLNVLPTDETYWVLGVATSEKTFNIDIIGEIESAIQWVTPSDLGTIKPNKPSRKVVEANSLLYGGRISYQLISGELPPGLEFLPNGIIQGKVRQFADSENLGLTRFYDVGSGGSLTYNTTFDDQSTSFDKEYTFTIRAKDGANFAESDRQFKITVVADSTKTFANLYVKSLQSKEKRLNWFNFITDATIFTPSDLYRYGDINFGIQSEIKMLLFAGIESVDAVKYIQAMSRNHYRKRFTFGDVKKALAKEDETQEVAYEVIYVDVVDDLEKNGKSISDTINLKDDINSKVLVSYDAIKVDSDVPLVSDSDHQRIFPNSVKNMRSRIRELGERDREFLPLWMRSIQSEGRFELGFTRALVLCYCKPGRADSIMARIKASNFDFKLIDFVADRYIIDVLGGEIEDKYLAYPQRGEKLP